jgi:hypothetical protein
MENKMENQAIKELKMETENKMEKQLIYNNQKVSSGTTWLLFLCFGWSYGRFDQIGKQILFYCTAGGFGIWALYLLFTLGGKIKKHNRKIAMRCGFNNEELAKYNLV